MAVDLDTKDQPPPEEQALQAWERDLEHIGIMGRLMAGRKWHGADWWFVAIAIVMVAGFIFVALFPGLIAPFNPREQVGPRLLAPGETPDQDVLILRVGEPAASLVDFAGDERIPTGVVRGAPASEAVRDQADRITEELNGGGDERRVRLRVARFETLDEVLDALVVGDVALAAASSLEFEAVADRYPDLFVAGPVDSDQGGGQSFLMGTNQLGQDVFSRVIWGTRIALIIGFSASLFSLALGVPLGLLAGFAGGKLDRVLTMIMDSLYAFPGLILAIAIAAVLGPSIFNIIMAIAVLYIPTYYRIVRGQTLSTKEGLFVEAARSLGAKVRVILTRYIFPNVVPSVAIIFSVNIADAILTGAGLSFLGLGLPPTTPDWGIDISRGAPLMNQAWWIITFPGIAVMLLVLAFTLLGEGLMEIFNPKLRDR